MKSEIRKPKIYLAAPFFSDDQINLLEHLEQALESNPFVDAYYSPMRNQVTTIAQGTPEWANAVYHNDTSYIKWSDIIVAVHDFEGSTKIFGEKHNHVDSGTAFEIGMAAAMNKPIILVNTKSGVINVKLSQSCHAYLTSPGDLEEYNFLKMPEIKYKGGIL